MCHCSDEYTRRTSVPAAALFSVAHSSREGRSRRAGGRQDGSIVRAEDGGRSRDGGTECVNRAPPLQLPIYGEGSGAGSSPRGNAKMRHRAHVVKNIWWQVLPTTCVPVRVNGPSPDKRYARLSGPGLGAPVGVVNKGVFIPLATHRQVAASRPGRAWRGRNPLKDIFKTQVSGKDYLPGIDLHVAGWLRAGKLKLPGSMPFRQGILRVPASSSRQAPEGHKSR